MMNRDKSALRSKLSRRAFLELVGSTAVLSLASPAPLASAEPSMATAPRSVTTIERYLGATRCALEELRAHEFDDYYLGTPYGNVAPGQMHPILATWDCWHPNGKPKSNGQAYMNCTGFIVAVLEACGADCDFVGSYVDSTGYNYGNKSNLERWRHFLDENAHLRTRYESKEDLLASGMLRKGDLILAEPNNWSVPSADSHIMFFWGDSPDEDRAWHSSAHGDGVVAGKAPGNMISRITAKTADCYWLHVPLTNLVEILVRKTSANIAISGQSGSNPAYSLSNAEFSIFRSYENGVLSDFVASFTTDENGEAPVELVPGETVWVREDTAPLGFASWDEPRCITVGPDGGELALVDEPCTIRLVLIKEDAETGSAAQGWGTLEGAVYELIDAAGSTHRAKTAWSDEHGGWLAAFDGVARGAARIREAVPPTGYLPDVSGDDGWHEVDLSPDSHEAVLEIPLDPHRELVIRGDIEGGKFREDPGDETLRSPLAGCVFTIWLQDDGTLETKGYKVEPITQADGTVVRNTVGEALRGAFIGEITSHEDGRFSTRDLLESWQPEEHGGMEKPEHALAFGTYTLVETHCPDPALRLIDPVCDIEVRSHGQEVFLILEDKRICSPVRVRKVDAESGLPLLRAGTTVELLRKQDDGDFNLVEFPVHYPQEGSISSFIVSETGFVQFPDVLEWGTYALREIAAIPPYVISDELVTFTVSEHHDWGDSNILEITLPNKTATGTIVGIKHDAENGEGVEGAAYEARAKYDVVLPDGTVAISAGDIAGTSTTDDRGAWRIDGLPLGDGTAVYEIRETLSPDGYALDSRVYEAVLRYRNDTTPIVETHLEIKEAPTEILVEKTDAFTGSPIEGVEFSAFLATEESEEGEDSAPEYAGDAADRDGRRHEAASRPVAVAVTDASGIARMLRLSCNATYRIQETAPKVDAGYVSQPAPSILRYLSPEGLWYSNRDAYENEVENEPVGGDKIARLIFKNNCTKIAIYKVDEEAWSALTRGHASKADECDIHALEFESFLSGGRFELRNERGDLIGASGACEPYEWSASAKQPHMFTHLPTGEKFTVCELEPPDGYAPGSPVAFTVEDTAEVQCVVVTNRRMEPLPQTLDGLWKPAMGLSVAAVAGGTALFAYAKRRESIKNGGAVAAPRH